MKRRELEKRLKNLGWWFRKHSGRHDLWTNGEQTEAVPRHHEVAEGTARSILRNAEKGMRGKIRGGEE